MGLHCCYYSQLCLFGVSNNFNSYFLLVFTLSLLVTLKTEFLFCVMVVYVLAVLFCFCCCLFVIFVRLFVCSFVCSLFQFRITGTNKPLVYKAKLYQYVTLGFFVSETSRHTLQINHTHREISILVDCFNEGDVANPTGSAAGCTDQK